MTVLRENCNAVILLTATPLYTGPRVNNTFIFLATLLILCEKQDLIYLQRMAGIGKFGEEADIKEKEHRKEELAIKRRMKAKVNMATTEDLNNVLKAQVMELREEWQGRIVRRSLTSPRYDGKNISQLDDFIVHAGLITLHEREKEVIEKITQEHYRWANSNIVQGQQS